MHKAMRIVAAAVLSGGFLLTGASAGQAREEAPAQGAAAVEGFMCGPRFYTVVDRSTYGEAGWVQFVGQAGNGDRSLKTFHPTRRTDEYRFRLGSGLVVGPIVGGEVCLELAPGSIYRPEARNGGQWWEGNWRQG